MFFRYLVLSISVGSFTLALAPSMARAAEDTCSLQSCVPSEPTGSSLMPTRESISSSSGLPSWVEVLPEDRHPPETTQPADAATSLRFGNASQASVSLVSFHF